MAGYEEVLDLIYASAADAALWPQLLERFAALLGGHAAALRSYHIVSEAGLVLAAGLDAGELDAKFRAFASCNPLKSPPETLERLRRDALKTPYVPGAKRDVEWLPKEDFIRTEYYNDFYRQFDIHSDVSIGLTAGDGYWTGIDIYRPKRHELFTDEDMALLAMLHPHLVRALELGRRLSAGSGVGLGMAQMFDLAPDGLFLLDRDARIRHMNVAGQRFVASRDGLNIVGGRLAGLDHRSTERLQALVWRAGAPDGDARAGGSMAIRTPSRALPLSIIAPIGADQAHPLFAGPAVILCIADLEADVSLPQQNLRELFGLTAAESRVAIALFEGLDPKAASEALDLSLATVRTHLAHIFGKTGAANQAGLARLMMRVLGARLTSSM
jgi:DNA-binding CsgD family transcriptional regulator/PAS domain-containing protein